MLKRFAIAAAVLLMVIPHSGGLLVAQKLAAAIDAHRRRPAISHSARFSGSSTPMRWCRRRKCSS